MSLQTVSALRALGEQTRWRVMRLLASKGDGMAAGDIAEALQGAAEYPVVAYRSPHAVRIAGRAPAGPANRLCG